MRARACSGCCSWRWLGACPPAVPSSHHLQALPLTSSWLHLPTQHMCRVSLSCPPAGAAVFQLGAHPAHPARLLRRPGAWQQGAAGVAGLSGHSRVWRGRHLHLTLCPCRSLSPPTPSQGYDTTMLDGSTPQGVRSTAHAAHPPSAAAGAAAVADRQAERLVASWGCWPARPLACPAWVPRSLPPLPSLPLPPLQERQKMVDQFNKRDSG